MTGERDEGIRWVSFAELESLLTKIFVRVGVSDENARILGINCAMCERDGTLSHSIFRIPGYLATLKSDWVDGKTRLLVEDAGGRFPPY